MPNPARDIAASLSAGLADRLRDAGGNAALLGVVALLFLTAWVALIAGLIVVLAPLWGMAVAIFAVALLVIVVAFILLAVVQRRVRRQHIRAEIRKAEVKAEVRRAGRAAVTAAIPGLLRNRPGASVILSGLAIGAMLAAILQPDDET